MISLLFRVVIEMLRLFDKNAKMFFKDPLVLPTFDQIEFVEKYQKLFDVAMVESKAAKKVDKIYLPIQFGDVQTLRQTPNEDVQRFFVRYSGRFSDVLRHFDSSIASGNIKDEIQKLIIAHKERAGSETPHSSRLYFWYAIEVSSKYADAFESAIILANFQLTGRESTFWNKIIPAIGDDMHLRTLSPKELINFGLYTLSRLVIKLKEAIADGSFFESKELLTTYDNFNDKERANFDKKYGLGQR